MFYVRTGTANRALFIDVNSATCWQTDRRRDHATRLCCSSGVGASGVFIALSVVLERMRFEGVVDVFQTVNILRTQRPDIVHTEVLAKFLHFSDFCFISIIDRLFK